MKPLNIDKTGCTQISSNCVTWQGPDIPCINLCKGDTVTDVVYKLATELCSVLDTLNLSTYELDCFQKGVCQPADFKAFIQLLINKVCALESCSPCAYNCDVCTTPVVTASLMATAGTDPIVNVAKEFYYVNQFGDTVTTMTLTEYVTAIGNKVSTQINTIAAIQNTLADHNKRITALEQAPEPTFTIPTIVPTGVLPREATEITSVVQVLESQFVQLRNATGTPNEIYNNIAKETSNLSSAKSLATPASTMSAIPGWTNSVKNEAESFGNLWLTVTDIRTALQNLIASYMPNECSTISIEMTAGYASNIVTIYINGTIPSSFTNANVNGTAFTITDTQGNSKTVTFNILSMLNNINGYPVSLEGSKVNPLTNLSIVAEPNFVNNTTGSSCKSYLQYTIQNQAACPAITYTPSAEAIQFQFTTDNGNRTYTLQVFLVGNTETPIASQTISSNTAQLIEGAVSGLSSGTAYVARMLVTVNGVTTTCEFTAITTL